LEEASRMLLMPEQLLAKESVSEGMKEEMSKEMEMLGF
jgi:hypothetical protein